MIVQKIDTHVQDALDRLLVQYKGLPRIKGLITALVQQIQDLEDAIYDLDQGRQFWNGTTTPAIGAQLDVIGLIVGIARNGLSDQQYILFIFGKIAENFSNGTRPEIATIVNNMFQAQTTIIKDYYPAGIGFEAIGSGIPSRLFELAKGIVEGGLSAGVKLVYAAASENTDVFRFYAPGIDGATNGFSGLSQPSIGGKFIGLI